MKIHKLTITDEELNEAVQMFLHHKGVTLPVESVSKEYSWQSESVVLFKEEKPEPALAKEKPSNPVINETNARALEAELSRHSALPQPPENP